MKSAAHATLLIQQSSLPATTTSSSSVQDTAQYLIALCNLKTCFEINEVLMIPIVKRIANKAKRLGPSGIRMLALRPEGSVITKLMASLQNKAEEGGGGGGSEGEEGILSVFDEWAGMAADALLWSFQWINHSVVNGLIKSQECKACLDVVIHLLSDPFMTMVLIQGFGTDPLNHHVFNALKDSFDCFVQAVANSGAASNVNVRLATNLWIHVVEAISSGNFSAANDSMITLFKDYDTISSVVAILEIEDASHHQSPPQALAQYLVTMQKFSKSNFFQIYLNTLIFAIQSCLSSHDKQGSVFFHLSFLLVKLPSIISNCEELRLDKKGNSKDVHAALYQLSLFPVFKSKVEFENESLLGMIVDSMRKLKILHGDDCAVFEDAFNCESQLGKFEFKFPDANISCASLEEFFKLLMILTGDNTPYSAVSPSLINFILNLGLSKRSKFYLIQLEIIDFFLLKITDFDFFSIGRGSHTLLGLECFREAIKYVCNTEVLSVLFMHGKVQQMIDNFLRFCNFYSSRSYFENVKLDWKKESLLLECFSNAIHCVLYVSDHYGIFGSGKLYEESRKIIEMCMGSCNSAEFNQGRFDEIYLRFSTDPSIIRPETFIQSFMQYSPREILNCVSHKSFQKIFASIIDQHQISTYFKNVVNALPFLAVPIVVPLFSRLKDIRESKPELVSNAITLIHSIIENLKGLDTVPILTVDILFFQLFKCVSRLVDIDLALCKKSQLFNDTFSKHKKVFLVLENDKLKILSNLLDSVVELISNWHPSLMGDIRFFKGSILIWKLCNTEVGVTKFLESILNVLCESMGCILSKAAQTANDVKLISKRARWARMRIKPTRIGEVFAWIVAHVAGIEVLEPLLRNILPQYHKDIISHNNAKAGLALSAFISTLLVIFSPKLNSDHVPILNSFWEFLTLGIKTLAETPGKFPPSHSSFLLSTIAILSSLGNSNLISKTLHDSREMLSSLIPHLLQISEFSIAMGLIKLNSPLEIRHFIFQLAQHKIE